VVSSPPARSVADDVFVICGLAWAAGLIHDLAAVDHLGEYGPFAACFATLAAVQFAAGVLVYRRPSPRTLGAVAALSIGTLAVWALSRTTGLPVGPGHWAREPVGALDVLAGADEATLAILVVAHLRARPATPVQRLAARACSAAGPALVAISSLAFMVGGAH
jgi:hypothetical protein